MTAVVRRIDHLMALVHDVGAAFETYTERLGLPIAWSFGRVDGWQSAGVSLGNANLELLSPQLASATPAASFFRHALESRGEGLFMMAFEPVDIESAAATLKERGVNVTGPLAGSRADPVGGAVVSWRNLIVDRAATSGVRTFLCQYDLQRRALVGGEGTLNVKKLDHVVIATEDLDAAAALWERNLGLKPDAALDKPLGAGFKVARLPIGDAFLELVQPVAKEGRFYQQFQERGEGMFSISVQVDDLAGAIGYLQSKGVRVSEPEPGIWPGSRVARINQKYTHGVSIQLIERQ